MGIIEISINVDESLAEQVTLKCSLHGEIHPV